jgi:hypothetical protein
MRNTAIKIAALGAALSLSLMTPALAEEPQPKETAEPVVTTQDSAPVTAEPVTNGDGEVVTLQTLQNEAEWRAATAEMLKRHHARRSGHSL